jgi:ABC-type nitrate/sulfonate/bicarbonate transport system substrate-binding protein
MRIAVIRIAALLVFAVVLVNAEAFAQLTKLNVGYVGVTSDNAAAFIARETGIYAKNGLDVQLIYFNSGSTAVTALITTIIDSTIADWKILVHCLSYYDFQTYHVE